MNKKTIYIVLIATTLLAACSQESAIRYNIIEDKPYDIPIKSQISLRVELQDTTATTEQIKALLHNLVKKQSGRKMKYNNPPTHVFIYIYKSSSDYENNSGSWLMMYEKNGKGKSGTYHYENHIVF